MYHGTLVSVDRVRMTMLRSGGGYASSSRTCVVKMSPYANTNGNTNDDTASFRSFVEGNGSFSFTILPQGQTTVVDNNSALNSFIYNFINNSGARSLCLNNGETSGTYNIGSTNYLSVSSFTLDVWATYI